MARPQCNTPLITPWALPYTNNNKNGQLQNQSQKKSNIFETCKMLIMYEARVVCFVLVC
jgi:hypothetical protein